MRDFSAGKFKKNKKNKGQLSSEVRGEENVADKEEEDEELHIEEREEESEEEGKESIGIEMDDSHTDNLNDLSFDIVTGTPPYFPSKNGALPLDAGRGQCAFECRGGIEAYIRACTLNISSKPFARFIVCQTYLEVRRTEESATVCGMVICKRLDVYGREGQYSPLFCVFSMRKRRRNERRRGRSKTEGVDVNEEVDEVVDEEEIKEVEEDLRRIESLNKDYRGDDKSDDKEEGGDGGGEVPYCVIPLYVRKLCGCHTSDYDAVMREMGRPLSSCGCGV